MLFGCRRSEGRKIGSDRFSHYLDLVEEMLECYAGNGSSLHLKSPLMRKQASECR